MRTHPQRTRSERLNKPAELRLCSLFEFLRPNAVALTTQVAVRGHRTRRERKLVEQSSAAVLQHRPTTEPPLEAAALAQGVSSSCDRIDAVDSCHELRWALRGLRILSPDRVLHTGSQRTAHVKGEPTHGKPKFLLAEAAHQPPASDW